MKIFLTGATGFLGQYLVKELAPHFDTIYILSRSPNNSIFKNYSNVLIVKGDITHLEIIENPELKQVVLSECDFCIHAAALYDLEAGHAESFLQNVVGTQNTLNLVKKMKKMKSFFYISTIAVGDDQSFFLEEDFLPERIKFNDYYSETKYKAEKIVRETRDQIPTRIIRPGVIIGDSVNGQIEKRDGPYYFIDLMKKYSSILKLTSYIPLSFNPRSKLPLIPVDHCARFITILILRDQGEKFLKTYHLISYEIPTISEFLTDLNTSLGLEVDYIPIFRNPFHNSLLKRLGIPSALIPFMFSKLSYDKSRTIEELPELSESVYKHYKSSLFRGTQL